MKLSQRHFGIQEEIKSFKGNLRTILTRTEGLFRWFAGLRKTGKAAAIRLAAQPLELRRPDHEGGSKGQGWGVEVIHAQTF